MTTTPDDKRMDECRMAFENEMRNSGWNVEIQDGIYTDRDTQGPWSDWHRAWSHLSDELAVLRKALKATDALVRDIRHRDARWHDDELVRRVLDANAAILSPAPTGGGSV